MYGHFIFITSFNSFWHDTLHSVHRIRNIHSCLFILSSFINLYHLWQSVWFFSFVLFSKKYQEIFYSLTHTHTHVCKIIVYFIELNNLIWRILLEKLTNENYSILKCLFEIFMGIIESLTFSRSRTFIEPNHWLYSHLIIITNQFKQTSIEQNSES